jgi:hypothetical protein
MGQNQAKKNMRIYFVYITLIKVPWFKIPCFIEYSLHFCKEIYDEILHEHYTWKVPENGFKINLVIC